MWLKTLFFLMVCMPLAVPAQASWLDKLAAWFQKPALEKPPRIKVLVVHDQVGVLLEVKGKYKIFDPHTGTHLGTRYVGKRKFIQAVQDGLKWGEEFPGVHQLVIVPDETMTTTIVDGIEYKGLVYVYDIGGTVSIINEVPIEEFLLATLPAQVREPLEKETLAAIAIAARTAAYYRSENPKSAFWAVDGRLAGYQGIAAIQEQSPLAQQIQATRYMVMSASTQRGKQLLPFLAVWRGSHYTPSAQDQFSAITLSEAEEMAGKGRDASQILARAFPGVKIELIHYAAEIVEEPELTAISSP
jgi:stage II sporulation protein D